MKKYSVYFVLFLVVCNVIVLSCTSNDSSPQSNVVVVPTISTSEASLINKTTAKSGGNLLSTGGGTITARGICYSTSHDPTTESTKISNPGTLGTFLSTLTGLTASTTYYVRAYASNTAGTAYGEEITFTTTANEISLPVLTTVTATEITSTTALSGGNITSDGGTPITQRGICWSLVANPTTSDNVVTATGTTGGFTTAITGLTSGTVYYVRAFATNAAGTAYGTQITFTTI